ncbi:hypothetical protein ACIBQ1_23205 [Nonomuraea sp. NPDC050153]|uniref:hypothetical protein n=1 Tax=Nonomuraea sp. NPDC050153 TaxID=3364359 RepID=UPI0037BCDF12
MRSPSRLRRAAVVLAVSGAVVASGLTADAAVADTGIGGLPTGFDPGTGFLPSDGLGSGPNIPGFPGFPGITNIPGIGNTGSGPSLGSGNDSGALSLEEPDSTEDGQSGSQQTPSTGGTNPGQSGPATPKTVPQPNGGAKLPTWLERVLERGANAAIDRFIVGRPGSPQQQQQRPSQGSATPSQRGAQGQPAQQAPQGRQGSYGQNGSAGRQDSYGQNTYGQDSYGQGSYGRQSPRSRQDSRRQKDGYGRRLTGLRPILQPQTCRVPAYVRLYGTTARTGRFTPRFYIGGDNLGKTLVIPGNAYLAPFGDKLAKSSTAEYAFLSESGDQFLTRQPTVARNTVLEDRTRYATSFLTRGVRYIVIVRYVNTCGEQIIDILGKVRVS